MIRTAKVIFCDNEHGGGDVTFPDFDRRAFDLQQDFINPVSVAGLRRQAKKEGWGRVNGGDYCPTCMDGGI